MKPRLSTDVVDKVVEKPLLLIDASTFSRAAPESAHKKGISAKALKMHNSQSIAPFCFVIEKVMYGHKIIILRAFDA